MGPLYGLLCATDPYMELCPHVCYYRQIVDKEMLIFDYISIFGILYLEKISFWVWYWVFNLLHRIPKVPKWTDTPWFSYVVSFYWPSFGLIAPPPYCASDYAQGPYMDLQTKVIFSYGHFSHLSIFAIFGGPLGSFLWPWCAFSSDQQEYVLFCNNCSIYGLLWFE